MRLGWTTSIAISLALGAGCGGGGDPGGDGAGGGPDAGPGEPDGGGDTGGASFIVVSNPVEPCQWENGVEICPPDHNQDLFRIDFDPEVGATGTIRLTDNSDGIPPGDEVRSPDDDTFFALDPARAWIYFGNSLAGAPDIYRIRADGSSPEPELLTKAGSAEYFLALSRDGQTIWFMSDMDGTFDLYRMDADGAGVANLSQSEQDIDEVLALLPDESGFLLRMGSGHDPEGTGEDAEIVHLRLSDGAMLPVTDDRVNSRMVALSRDGQLVFYTRYDDENQDGVVDGGNNLWVARVDGAEPPRRLTSYDAPSLELMAVTPDGARVIYEFRSDKKEIYSLATAGGEPVQLSDSPGGESSYFRLLSADGQVVIYTSNDRPGGFGDIEMYRVPVTGGPSQLLTDFENESYFLPFAHLADAGALLYESPIDGDNDFYVVPMAGGEHVNVTRNDGWGDSGQGLSPDGAYIFFSNLSDDPVYDEDGMLTEENDQDIYITRTDGTGAIHQLSDNRVYDRLVAIAMPGGAAPGARAGLRPAGASLARPCAGAPLSAPLWRRAAPPPPAALAIDDGAAARTCR